MQTIDEKLAQIPAGEYRMTVIVGAPYVPPLKPEGGFCFLHEGKWYVFVQLT